MSESTELMPVPAADLAIIPPKANPRIGKKRLMDSALRGIVVVGTGATAFILLDPALEKQVAKDLSQTNGNSTGKTEVDIRNKYGAGAVVGGIALGIGGFALRPQLGVLGDAMVGAGVGVATAGAVQLKTASELKKQLRVAA